MIIVSFKIDSGPELFYSFEAETRKDEANPKMRMKQHLKKESDSATDLVLWLDCDREGENICYEVISCIPNIRIEFESQ